MREAMLWRCPCQERKERSSVVPDKRAEGSAQIDVLLHVRYPEIVTEPVEDEEVQ